MSHTTSLLGTLDAPTFLRRHWQKSPLLVRGAVDPSRVRVEPDELAGLACQSGAEARIVRQSGPRTWHVQHGPFAEPDFARLPESRWTLLVQGVDRWRRDVAELLDDFDFVPNWRIDDVMVSYAAADGGVGPHLDSYDVFLIQARGRRRWAIGDQPLEDDEELIAGADHRVLGRFHAAHEWILDAGDLLYLPPRIPHHGVAVDPCMTYSVGFRAPSHRELAAALLARCVATVDPKPRYTDPWLTVQADPGRIDERALAEMRAAVLRCLDDEAQLRACFGCLVTEPRREHEQPLPRRPPTVPALYRTLRRGATLRRLSVTHFAYVTEPAGTRLFVGGVEHTLNGGIAGGVRLLCGRQPLSWSTLGPYMLRTGFAALLARLVGEGYLLLDRHG